MRTPLLSLSRANGLVAVVFALGAVPWAGGCQWPSPESAKRTPVSGAPAAHHELLLIAPGGTSLDIFIAHSDGRVVKLVESVGDDMHAEWSPTGDHVAFASGTAEGFQLFTVAADGSDLRQITTGKGSVSSPSWSPDGRHIVFVGGSADGDLAAYIVELSSGRIEQLTDGQASVSKVLWSPTGEWIAVSWLKGGQSESLALLRPDGSQVTELTGMEDPGVLDAAWAPDGLNVYFTARKNRATEQYSVDIRSREIVQHTRTAGLNSIGAVDAGGKRLLFLSNRDLHSILQVYQLDLESGAVRRLTDAGLPEDSPSWSSDACYAVLTRFIRGAYQTVVLDLRSGAEQHVAAALEGTHLQPKFRPRLGAPLCVPDGS